MSTQQYISRLVNLTLSDRQTILQYAYEKGFGEQGFSAALRGILREWVLLRTAFRAMPGGQADRYTELSSMVISSVGEQDRLLESGASEIEFPSAESEPEQSVAPKVPQNDYDAALWQVRAQKFSPRRRDQGSSKE